MFRHRGGFMQDQMATGGSTLQIIFGVLCTFLFVLSMIYTIRALTDEQYRKSLKTYGILSALFAAGMFYAAVTVW